MGIIFDLILIAIILISVLVGYKKGFVRTAVRFVGMILALIIAVSLSSPMAELTFNKFVQPSVRKTLELSLQKVTEGSTESFGENLYESLPEYVKNNTDVSELGQFSENTADDICETLVKPIAISFLRSIFTSIIFIILSILVAYLAVFLNSLFSFSIIGKANRIFGGCIGILEGAIFAMMFVVVTHFIISLTGGFLIFTEAAVTNSWLLRTASKILPTSFLI